jgi:hypothetical protein
MTQSTRGVLIAGLLTLISPGTASAECAWVLWAQTRTWWPKPPATDQWDIVEVFETKGACEARRPKTNSHGFDEQTRISTATRYVCYPETMDPRGPKGK